MAANTNTIDLTLTVDDKGSVTIENSSKKMTKSLETTSRTISQKMGGAFSKMGRGAVNVFSSIKKSILSLQTAIIGLAVYGISRVISKWEELTEVQEKAEAGTKAAMISMGRYSEVANQAILDTAAALQQFSTFGDEAILMGTKFLMTYEKITDRLMPRTMKIMTDLAALMKGDFVSAANMLGKASMGMVGELRRAGISIQKEMAGDFEQILNLIERQVGGQAEALRKATGGTKTAMDNLISDVQEKMGKVTLTVKDNIAKNLLPIIEKVNAKLGEYISSGRMEEDAKRWAGIIIEHAKKAYSEIKGLYKLLSDFGQILSDWWNKPGIGVMTGPAFPNIGTGDVPGLGGEERGQVVRGPVAGSSSSIIDAMNRSAVQQVQANIYITEKMSGHDVAQNIKNEVDRITYRDSGYGEEM